MKRILFIGILLLLIAAGCSPIDIFDDEEAEPRIPVAFTEFQIPLDFIPQPLTITALGDSLSQGVGDENLQGGYVGRLAEDIEAWPSVEETIVENTAKRGRRSDQLLKMFEQGELEGPLSEADLVTLTIGGNDLMKIFKRDLLSLNIEAFIEELKFFEERFSAILAETRTINPTVPIVVMGLYNPFSLFTDEVSEFDEILGAYNDMLKTVTEQDPQACYVPVTDLFIGNDNLVYHTDFFHPNANGYELMSDRILERMEQCGFINEE